MSCFGGLKHFGDVMNAKDEKKYITNLKLMKITGFYQLIDPSSSRLYRAVATVEIAISVISILMLSQSSYYFFHDTNELMSHFMLIVAISFSAVKLYTVSRNSDPLWECLETTSVDFLPSGCHGRDALRAARARSVSASVVFVALWSSVTVAWCVSPFFVDGATMDARSADGCVRRFRYNALNYVYPVTEEFYDRHYLSLYAVEMVQVVIWGHATSAYDTFVMSMCISAACQLKTIADSCARLCSRLADDGISNTKITEDIESENISHLKLLIQDQQTMLQKIRKMYQVFEPVTFFQLAAQSMLIIFQAYMIFINHYNGLSLISVPIIKLVLTVTPNIIHLFITCYLFGYINDQKESMNFALYSSDWTETSINYKKIILLTMRMNSAEKMKLKISLKRIVNLEMFASVMHTTYSIISVLAKSYGKTGKV